MVLLAVLLQEVVDKHSDKEVLETCAKTLERLCDDRHAIYSRCDIARSRLLDMVSHHNNWEGPWAPSLPLRPDVTLIQE